MAGTLQADGEAPLHWRHRMEWPGLQSWTGIAAFEGAVLVMLAGVLAWAAVSTDLAGLDAEAAARARQGAIVVAAVAVAVGACGWLLFQMARLERVFALQAGVRHT